MRHPWRGIALLPALRIFILLASGIFLRWHAPAPPDFLWAVGSVLLAVSVLLLLTERAWPPLRPLRDAALTALLVCCGMLRCGEALHDFPLDLLPFADLKEKVVIRGNVAGVTRNAIERQRFALDVTRVISGTDTHALRGRIMLSYGRSRYDTADTLAQVRTGDVLEARCRLRVPRPPRNPYAFDSRSWLLQEGMILQASVSKGRDLHVVRHGAAPWWRLLVGSLRDAARAAIAVLYESGHTALMNGLLLGDSSGIDEETLDDFRRSGILHILAVSGSHSAIVLMMVFYPLERLRFPLRAAVAIAALWLFAAITGFAPPVTRATLMATLFLVAIILQRGGNGINTLAVAGVIIAVADPLSLLGLSFQLSFVAVLGIVLFQERIQRTLAAILPGPLRGKHADVLVSLVALTIAAQALTLPLLIDSFGQLSLSGLLTNVAAVPLVFVVVSCGILSVLVLPLWTAPAQMLASTAGAALDLLLVISDALAAVPYGVVDIPALPSTVLILYVAAVAYLAATPGRMRQKSLILALFILTALVSDAAVSPAPQPRLRVTFLDVGQGDAILLEIPGADAWLIDTGPGDEHMNSGTFAILPFLRANGITRLGALVITHPDNDHAGGAAAVLNGVRVDSAFISCAWSKDGETGALLSVMKTRTRGVRDLRAGERFVLGDQARLYVLSPPADTDCTPSNDNSIVLLLVYGKTRFLFCGDAGVDAEHRMITCYDTFLRADVLKVGHHGSSTSTSPGFAVKVKPKHAVISVGRNNHFNHPRQEILDRLRLLGARIHRTDTDGAVIFESDGRRVRALRWSR